MMDRVPLIEVLESLETGKRPKGGAIEHGVPSLGGEHISAEGTLKLAPMKYVPEDFYQSMSKGRLQVGDVLVVKDGATTGRVGMVESTFPFGRAGVNEHLFLLRADQRRLDPRFLYFYLRSTAGQVEIMSDFRGAAQGGISREIGTKVHIPLWSLAEQRRIVDLLARAECIVRLRREAQQKAAELIPALFIDMFGDPATNPRGWLMRRIADICMLVRGSSPRPQGDPQFFGGPVPRLMIADITRDGVYVTPTIDSLTVEGATKSRPMAAGDVVMAVSGAVGLPAILAVDACIHDGFVGFRKLDTAITSEYLYGFLNAYRRHSVLQAVGATFQNLKTDQIKEWLVPLPPLAAQHQFQWAEAKLRGLNRQQARATAMAVATFQSLLHRAFQAG